MCVYPLTVNGDVGSSRLRPTARIEVLNAVSLDLHRFVCMTAEDPLCATLLGVRQRSL